MSKLHVNQIEGYLTAKTKSVVNMDDDAGHSDSFQIKKAFLCSLCDVHWRRSIRADGFRWATAHSIFECGKKRSGVDAHV
jgi:hypothetical protein